MKYVACSLILVLTVFHSIGQSYRTETVDWLHPKIYKARKFTFKSDSVTFIASNCKLFEIRTVSGVTGYYVEGESMILIDSKNIKENCTAAMFRFNPADVDSFISTDGMKDIEDDAFVNASFKILKSTFRHCYHSGMDAIIPETGAYALNFFGLKMGEVLVSKNRKEIIYYNFTLGVKM